MVLSKCNNKILLRQEPEIVYLTSKTDSITAYTLPSFSLDDIDRALMISIDLLPLNIKLDSTALTLQLINIIDITFFPWLVQIINTDLAFGGCQQ